MIAGGCRMQHQETMKPRALYLEKKKRATVGIAEPKREHACPAIAGRIGQLATMSQPTPAALEMRNCKDVVKTAKPSEGSARVIVAGRILGSVPAAVNVIPMIRAQNRADCAGPNNKHAPPNAFGATYPIAPMRVNATPANPIHLAPQRGVTTPSAVSVFVQQVR